MKRILFILLLIISTAKFFAQVEQDACLDGRVYRYTTKGLEGMLYHWQAENGTILNSDPYNDTVFIRWQTIGSFKLSVYGELDGCFSDIKELKVNLHTAPYFYLGDDVTLCQGSSKTFEIDDKKITYTQIKWQNGEVGKTFTTDSTQKVWADITDINGCKMTDTAEVFVRSLPYINLGNDTALCGDQTVILNASSPLFEEMSYSWKIPNVDHNYITEPSLLVDKNGIGKYTLRIEDAFGCVSFDSVEIKKCSNVFDRNNIGIAFTPNNDGRNDVWEIKGLTDEFPGAMIDVFDRGGRLVYRSDKGYTKPWNGRDLDKKVLPMATYFYIIYLNNKENDKIAGSINVLR